MIKVNLLDQLGVKLNAVFPTITFIKRSGFWSVDNKNDIEYFRSRYSKYIDCPKGYYRDYAGYMSKLLNMKVIVELYDCEYAILFHID